MIEARLHRAALGALLAIIAGGAPFASVRVAGAQTAHAEAWRWESPRPQGNTLRGACTDAEGEVWVAGELGALGTLRGDARSFDAATVRGTSDLIRVACCPGGVVAVGVGGTVVRRDASGSVREQMLGSAAPGGSGPNLTGVACVGDRGVVISSVDRALWVSSDGGEVFARRAAPHELYAVHSVGAVLVASGPAGVVSRSLDLGRTWSTVSTGVLGNLMAFAGDAHDLVAVGTRGVAARSVDAGERWSIVSTGVSADLFAVVRATGGETLAVGAADVALVLGASGAFSSAGALPGRFHALAWSDGRWLAGGVGGRIAVRRGRGRFTVAPRWEPSLQGTWSDARIRLVVGDRGFVARADGPRELRQVRVPTVGALFAVTGNAAGVALAVGAQGVILRSSDRGARWRVIPVPVRRMFNSVWLDDQGHALVAGEDGQRFRSDDGGLHWASVSAGTDVQFTGIASHGSTLWTAARGRIERSDDLGATWQSEAPPSPSADLRTPFVTARGTLIVTERPGIVWRRDARGAWTRVDLNPSAVFTGLSGDERELLLVASDGAMFASPDDGVTWVEQRAVTREVLTSVRFAPGGRAYVTGYGGTLLSRP